MRLLFVLGGLRIGGYEVLSVKIANELAERKNEVAIISLSSDSKILERVSANVKIHFVTRKFKYDFSIIPRVLKIFHNFKPDIILNCAFFVYFIVKFASFLYAKKSKFILAFHLTKPFNQKEDRWNRIYAFFAKPFNDNYIAIHKSQIDFYNRHYGLPKNRFTLIHNGVDTRYFHPIETANTQNDGIFRIAHVASLKPLKDQWTLLKAMVELDKIHKKWELMIAGADKVNILPKYRDFVSQNKITAKIKFLGPVKDPKEVLKKSDVFILTSLTEALPLSVIEAIAMGLPCIVTNVGGNSDIIEDCKEGFLVKPEDYKAIAQYLKFLIDNPNKREEIRIAARKKAVTQFDFSVMMEKYYNLFRDILKT